MNTKLQGLFLLVNEINKKNNIFLQNLNILFRLIYLFYILVFNYFEFKITNFIYYLKKLPKIENIELIKNITLDLENFNIVYVKLFQSLCIEKNLLNNEEMEYLYKYTDNVPYTEDDIEYFSLHKIEEEYNILFFKNEPINSGIIAITFNGIKDGTNIIVKLLKKDIAIKLNNFFDEIELLTTFISFIPILKRLNLKKLFLDNKELLLNQVDFIKEVNNIEIFTEKNKNLNAYKIPKVYSEITKIYNNVIVMEDIRGMKYEYLKNYDDYTKTQFSKLLIKFGYISIFYNNAIHGDLHAGNLFFYINDNSSELPKYQIGLIDFGICIFPDKINQLYYYYFFNDMFYKKEFDNIEKIEKIIKTIIEEKNNFNNLKLLIKNNLINEIIECAKFYFIKELDLNFIKALSKILKKYGFNFSKEFNKIVFSLNTGFNLSKSLVNNITQTQIDCLKELNEVYNIIEI